MCTGPKTTENGSGQWGKDTLLSFREGRGTHVFTRVSPANCSKRPSSAPSWVSVRTVKSTFHRPHNNQLASALLTRHLTFNSSTDSHCCYKYLLRVQHLATGNYDLSTLHLAFARVFHVERLHLVSWKHFNFLPRPALNTCVPTTLNPEGTTSGYF